MSSSVKDEISQYFSPHQVGFGIKSGCEAAIHATRTFIHSSKSSNRILLKIDFKNAFNSVERDVMLNEIMEKTPYLYNFFGNVTISQRHFFMETQQLLRWLVHNKVIRLDL